MVLKEYTKNKGQLSFINIVGVFISIILIFVFLPVINDIMETTITNLPDNEYKALLSTLIWFVPIMLILGLFITIVSYANPPSRANY